MWLANAEAIAGAALFALVKPASQPLATQMPLIEQSLRRSRRGLQLAVRAGAPQAADMALQAIWSAAQYVARSPAARPMLVPHLSAACRAVGKLGTRCSGVLCEVSALLCACLLASGRADDALAHSSRAIAMCPQANQALLWAWHIKAAVAASQICDNPESAMSRIGSFPGSFQAQAWLMLAQTSTNAAVQSAAFKRCLHAVAQQPQLSARYHILWAGWLLSNDTSKAHAAEAAEALLHAQRLLLPSTTSESARAPGQQSAAHNPHAQGAVDAPDAMLPLRAALLLAECTGSASKRLDWLRTARHHAADFLERLLTGAEPAANPGAAPDASEQLPKALGDWLHYLPPQDGPSNASNVTLQSQLQALTSDRPELLQHALDELCRALHAADCPAECVPVRWLQYHVADAAQGQVAAAARLLHLAHSLQELGLAGQADECIKLAGVSLPCQTAAERHGVMAEVLHACLERQMLGGANAVLLGGANAVFPELD